MPTDTKYSKKQLNAMMKRYTLELLQPHSFTGLPVKFMFEVSQYGNSVCCHLRTAEGVLLKVGKLIEWFDELPEAKQTEILEI